MGLSTDILPPFIFLRVLFLDLRQKERFLPLLYLHPDVRLHVDFALPRHGDLRTRRAYTLFLEAVSLRIDLVATIIV